MALNLILWALLGLVGGGAAYRLAVWLSERPGAGGAAPPLCPHCGQLETPVHPVALPRLSRAACGPRLPREQTVVALAAAVLIDVLRLRLGDDVAAVVPALATLVLVTATLTDLRARLIPNALTYPATALALAASPLPGGVGLLPGLLGAAVGGGGALLIWLGGRLLYRRGDVFGLGDVKLAVFIGAAVGLGRALTALVTGVLVGGLFGLLVLLAGQSRRTTMPYGPALAIGAYLTLLLARS